MPSPSLSLLFQKNPRLNRNFSSSILPSLGNRGVSPLPFISRPRLWRAFPLQFLCVRSQGQPRERGKNLASHSQGGQKKWAEWKRRNVPVANSELPPPLLLPPPPLPPPPLSMFKMWRGGKDHTVGRRKEKKLKMLISRTKKSKSCLAANNLQSHKYWAYGLPKKWSQKTFSKTFMHLAVRTEKSTRKFPQWQGASFFPVKKIFFWMKFTKRRTPLISHKKCKGRGRTGSNKIIFFFSTVR